LPQTTDNKRSKSTSVVIITNAHRKLKRSADVVDQLLAGNGEIKAGVKGK
jgi:hypothetical protein